MTDYQKCIKTLLPALGEKCGMQYSISLCTLNKKIKIWKSLRF